MSGNGNHRAGRSSGAHIHKRREAESYSGTVAAFLILNVTIAGIACWLRLGLSGWELIRFTIVGSLLLSVIEAIVWGTFRAFGDASRERRRLREQAEREALEVRRQTIAQPYNLCLLLASDRKISLAEALEKLDSSPLKVAHAYVLHSKEKEFSWMLILGAPSKGSREEERRARQKVLQELLVADCLIVFDKVAQRIRDIITKKKGPPADPSECRTLFATPDALLRAYEGFIAQQGIEPTLKLKNALIDRRMERDQLEAIVREYKQQKVEENSQDPSG